MVVVCLEKVIAWKYEWEYGECFMDDYLDKASNNLIIYDSFIKAESMLS